MQDLFAALPMILEKFGEDDTVRESVVFATWRRVAGDGISEHTVPVGIDDGRLIIAVSGKAWKRHLEDLAGELLFRINRLLASESVKFIEFTENASLVAESRERDEFADSFAAAEAEITPELRRAAMAIGDMEMRRRFLLAAGSCIAREKRLSANED